MTNCCIPDTTEPSSQYQIPPSLTAGQRISAFKEGPSTIPGNQHPPGSHRKSLLGSHHPPHQHGTFHRTGISWRPATTPRHTASPEEPPHLPQNHNTSLRDIISQRITAPCSINQTEVLYWQLIRRSVHYLSRGG